MAIITVPTNFSFVSIPEFRLQRASNILRSKYTGQGQVISFPYAVWFLKGKLVEYDGLNAGKVRSFLAQLDGQKNTFRLPVPGFSKPMSSYNENAATVNYTAARASSITLRSISGLANVAFLSEGDYFTINDELKIVTSTVNLGPNAGLPGLPGYGTATIEFKPPLRKPAVNSTVVTLINPTILMRALDDDVAKWSIAAPIRQNTGFEAVEAVDI